MAKNAATIDWVAIIDKTDSRPMNRKRATQSACQIDDTILMVAYLRFSSRPFMTAAVMVMTFVAKMPGKANRIAAWARRVGIPGKRVSRGAMKHNRSAALNVNRLANVVIWRPPC